MQNYQFILILNKPEGGRLLDKEKWDLSEIPGSEWVHPEGMLALEFHRESSSLQEAILSAIQDVSSSSLPFTVARIGEYDLVTKPVIVDRAGISNRRLFEFINGERGPGNFPQPLYEVGVTQFYSWREIRKWLRDHTEYQFPNSHEDSIPEIVNALISLKNAGASKEQVEEIWSMLD